MGHFYWEWFRGATSGPYLIAESIGFALAIILGIITWKRPLWEGKMKHLPWMIMLAVLIGGIILGAIVAPYNIYKGQQHEVDSTLDSVRFHLAFNNAILGPEPITISGDTSLRVGICLENTSDQPIQYNIVVFRVILNGRTVSNPTFLSEYAYAGTMSNYFYPPIYGIDLTKEVTGTLEYEIHYSSIPNKHWYMSKRTLSLNVTPDLTSLKVNLSWYDLAQLPQFRI